MGECLLEGEPTDSPAHELAHLIGTISEDTYSAGWLDGIEFIAWSWVERLSRHQAVRPRWSASKRCNPIDFGMSQVDPLDVERMRELSEQLGGWVAWVGNGVRFVPMGEWLKMEVCSD